MRRRSASHGRRTFFVRPAMFVLAAASICAPASLHGQTLTLNEAVRTAELTLDPSTWLSSIARWRCDKSTSLGPVDGRPSRSLRWGAAAQPIGYHPRAWKPRGLSAARWSYPGPNDDPAESLTFWIHRLLQCRAAADDELYNRAGHQFAQVGVAATTEQVRAKRQGVVNEVRRLYYGIAQAESGKATLQATVDFLKQLDRETNQQVVQRVALQAELLNVRAQLIQAEYELLKWTIRSQARRNNSIV